MNPQHQALLEQFRDYLEESEQWESIKDTQEDTPEDTQDEQKIDLFTLFSELSALKNEVKHESRQLKEALSRFGELFDTLQRNQQRLERAQDEVQQTGRDAKIEAQREILLEILDLRDRIESNEQFLQSHQPGWLHRMNSREQQFQDDLQQGLEITLRNFDHLLQHNNVTPIATNGTPFDPHTMRVEAVEQRPEQSDGAILGVVRSGYLLNGETLRTARVIVNKLQENNSK
ncbi:MAG: nucleotide exchange factor GrpE [Gammaproteobacteria bacterium]|jgi:molecular chaperone GrpE|nr:nucleotide exchange factor GrpE [Gammaproteobacteria bacterium]MBT4608181.1 nucleotide exchange factor GrpE [Thiotrichales bacterium]MBT5745281.1 nucleotide exchange factor GrpE [Gammaproteobacteria bacterium]MBT7023022.1 nucleotide exchange factor GrpE [Gammaproteobacteria bacterium]